jgi:uncharacterized protein (DUF1778 family)
MLDLDTVVLMLLRTSTVSRRKAKSQRKEESIRIRLTAGQKRLLIEAATRTGLDVSSWLRLLGLQAASRKSLATDLVNE